MKVLTEADLRAAMLSENTKEYHVTSDIYITPTAKEFLKDRGISLVVGVPAADASKAETSMTVTKIAQKGGKAAFVNAETGETYDKKPEEMTHLRGNLLVYKTHPRIEFRGHLDSLQARILLLRKKSYVGEMAGKDLDDVLGCVRLVLGSEVKGENVPDTLLFGLNEERIHHMSHNVKEEFGIPHPIPDHKMSEFALELNFLRTEIRKAELAAANAFPNGDELGIIKTLNRLSSGVYIMFCREIVGRYS